MCTPAVQGDLVNVQDDGTDAVSAFVSRIRIHLGERERLLVGSSKAHRDSELQY
jgi:hypothetical protein